MEVNGNMYVYEYIYIYVYIYDIKTPSGKRKHNELDISIMRFLRENSRIFNGHVQYLMGKLTNLQLGHGFNSELLVIARGYGDLQSDDINGIFYPRSNETALWVDHQYFNGKCFNGW